MSPSGLPMFEVVVWKNGFVLGLICCLRASELLLVSHLSGARIWRRKTSHLERSLATRHPVISLVYVDSSAFQQRSSSPLSPATTPMPLSPMKVRDAGYPLPPNSTLLASH